MIVVQFKTVGTLPIIKEKRKDKEIESIILNACIFFYTGHHDNL